MKYADTAMYHAKSAGRNNFQFFEAVMNEASAERLLLEVGQRTAKQLPLSCLKLDRSFVMDIEGDANDAAICTATIQLAHSLGLGVVAESVETAAQLEFLRRLGCDTVQGYFISKPLPAAEMTRFLQQEKVEQPA